MGGIHTPAHKEKLNRLRRECFAKGIRYVSHLGVRACEERLANPYPYQLETWVRRTGIKPYDFRAKGITPKPGSWVKWKPKHSYARMLYRCVGRLVSYDLDKMEAVVSYSVMVGGGYKSKRVTVHPFQIVDYREDR